MEHLTVPNIKIAMNIIKLVDMDVRISEVSD